MCQHLTTVQYATDTNSQALLSAQEEMLGEGASDWRVWFNGEQGPVLPPCSLSSCSVFEKLVLVQLYVFFHIFTISFH
jgi:hypothetical protein